MTLDEALKIKQALDDLYPNAEIHNWGPSLEFAEQSKRAALRIIRREIKQLRKLDRDDLKEIRSSLGYSRIGRNNV